MQKWFYFLFLTFGRVAFCQNATQILGKIIDAKTQVPLPQVVVRIQNSNQMQFTSATGVFFFENCTVENPYLLIQNQGYKDKLIALKTTSNTVLDLGIIPLEEDLIVEQQLGLIALSETDINQDDGTSETASGMLQASRDVFQQAVAFGWSAARFRVRGLDSAYQTTLINGLIMNKSQDGRPQWANWGGLNDVLRNQELYMGTSPSDYAFGAILGTTQINARASIFKKGLRISNSVANAMYTWRTMATYASGQLANGWSFVFSASKRYAKEAFFEGTTFDGQSVFIAIEKQLNPKQAINFSAFYAPSTRGKSAPNTQEVIDLMGYKYNPYWGFQEGEKRNARNRIVEEPIFMLNHFFKISDKTQLNTSLMHQFGKVGNTNIDFQNTINPDPAYYLKMPSYFSSRYARDDGEFSGIFTPDFENASKSKALFLANSQLSWANLYRGNQKTISDASGTIVGYAPDKSNTVLYEDHISDTSTTANTVLTHSFSEKASLTAGVTYRNLKSHRYKKLLDLLGGAYFEDLDGFYSGTQAQADLNFSNRKVGLGQAYGYNFIFSAQTLEAFTQLQFGYNKIDFYLAQHYAATQYQREGLFKSGLYPTLSFGKSAVLNFENFGFKGGMTFKFSGKQSCSFHAAHLSKAPTLQNSFPNSRLNNSLTDGLQNETNSSIEANYCYRSPKLKVRFTAYYALVKNSIQNSFFFAEGIFDNGAGFDQTSGFVSAMLTDLDKKNRGLELGLEYQIHPVLKTSFAFAYGQYTYANNPSLRLTNDAKATPENPNPILDFGPAYLENYKQGGTPQHAFCFGLEYRNPRFWWLASNLNYLADCYIDVSPIARTNRFYINPVSGFPFPEATESQGKHLLEQEKFSPVLLLNLSGGKSWRRAKKTIGFFASINNFSNSVYKTGGFEQSRNGNFRQRDQDVSSGTPNFGNKYFYGLGRTYFLNLYINW